MPGGDTRSVSFHRPYPLMIARGARPFLWDAYGNRYSTCSATTGGAAAGVTPQLTRR
jgi:glutamate-1-semialdehyde 2,1-aminomutase